MSGEDDRSAERGQQDEDEPALPELLKRDIALMTARAMSRGAGTREALISALTEVLGPRARSQVQRDETVKTEGIVGLPRESPGRRQRWEADDAYLVLTDKTIIWASSLGEVDRIPLDLIRHAGIDRAGVVKIVVGLAHGEVAEQLFFFGGRRDLAPLRATVLAAVAERVAVEEYPAGR